ncbi:hypothetical protein PHMEG_00017044 [Phytophthora megakarya]|uniref:Uncharacterized protein n=1 Tax=Phytophthora megakarya TaxID=4795 RepID=A0A225VZC6_9STRA|nr:hypothetical protein PHMEG_00017044 [Phytophthora megakarya]
MSPNGLSNIIKNIRRRRQARYYKLYTLLADRVHHFRASIPNYAAPTFPTVSDYCAIHSVMDSKVLTSAWMEATAIYGPLCELLIQTMSNEVGQIVGRRLTKSENNEETGALLGNLIPTLKTNGDGCIYLVSDNANCVRGMV